MSDKRSRQIDRQVWVEGHIVENTILQVLIIILLIILSLGLGAFDLGGWLVGWIR